MGPDAMILVFWMLSFKPTFPSPLSLSSRASLDLLRFLPLWWCHLHIIDYWYFSQQSRFQPVLHLVQHFIYSAYKLNKQGDNMQPWPSPFPIWNQAVLPRPVLTVAFWPAYRFLRRQVRRSGTPISWRIFHFLLWFTQSKVLAQSIKQK